MRVMIATRIFGPEISAASGILRTWAEEFRDRGHEVVVLTAKPPRGMTIDDPPGIRVRRAAVKRDRQQYVRGYLSYMSFDVPLAFRLLFGPKPDLLIVEPPPTTVAVARVIAWLRRVPYAVRAADYWTEAAELVTSNPLVIGTLRRLERWGLNGAAMLFAAHEPLLARFREVGITAPAMPIGFGADTKDFLYGGEEPPSEPRFVYAGTYSEWHGAGVFLEAMPAVLEIEPNARLDFYGNGEDREALQARVAELGLEHAVAFHAPISPAELSPILAAATASVASLAPLPPNDYALATKVYSSLAAGCPVIYAGRGPTVAFLNDAEHPRAGTAVAYEPAAVSQAMLDAAAAPLPPAERTSLAIWSAREFSLTRIAARVADAGVKIAAA